MRKIITLGIMLLFLGMTISSSTGLYLEKQSIKPLSSGNILYVGGSGPGNYSKIQDAIENASDGDTVFVYNGTYVENLIVNKSVHLIGEDRDTTIIDGNENGDVVNISTDFVYISRVTIKNSGDWPHTGIKAINSNNNTFIHNNIILNNDDGIYLYNSSNNTVSDNNISSNNVCGMRVYFSDNNIITGNTISDNLAGIDLIYSNYNIVSDNVFCSNTHAGISIHYSSNNIISDNSCFNDGFEVWNSHQNTILNNTVNDKALIYLESESNIVIDGNAGQVILVNCDNITVQKQDLSNTTVGIELWSTNNSFIFCNNINSNNWDGIALHRYSSNNTIVDNNIGSNTDAGVKLTYSTSNNIITNNNICSNKWDGIYLYHSSNNIISGNNINSNKEYGIHLWDSNSNNITGNILSNSKKGIYFFDSNDKNIIYHNNFINNTQNAYDECNNSWDNGYPSGGNYWDDYNGTDNDGDGIGDTPYYIPGGDNEDRYPLMEPYGNGDENETFFGTLGPICPLLNIAEINLIDGNESQIQKIEKILNNRILQFIIPPWGWFINVTELDFTISYNKKIPNIPFWWNFKYFTILQENENDTVIDKPHTVTVKGLNGTFVISRGQPLRFRPPYFVFAGDTYDEVTIELIERGRV